jgi:hypothetical protein
MVMTPPLSVKLGFDSVMVTRTAANAAVQISMNAGDALASRAVMTACIRVLFKEAI